MLFFAPKLNGKELLFYEIRHTLTPPSMVRDVNFRDNLCDACEMDGDREDILLSAKKTLCPIPISLRTFIYSPFRIDATGSGIFVSIT